MTFRIFMLFFVISISTSCKKKEIVPSIPAIPCVSDTIKINNNDTIFPNNISVAYPGSWWKYNDNSIDSCTGWSAYIKSTKPTNDLCATVTNETLIVPNHSRLGLIYDDYPFNNSGTPLVPLVDFQVGDVIYLNITGFGSGDNHGTVTKKVTFEAYFSTLTIQGSTYSNVLKIEYYQQTYYDHASGGPIIRETTYYAENVGIIKYQKSNFSDPPWLDLELTDHFIVPH